MIFIFESKGTVVWCFFFFFFFNKGAKFPQLRIGQATKVLVEVF